ncbi:MAG TPA: 5'-methylthioadenosine/adenosylhomocysteine nucleosidase [Planctomycetota bacterium]|nr:5'-methylthioadenosine/adenosylhomocysteine nucleosidase [Planctomycetota bacterium]
MIRRLFAVAVFTLLALTSRAEEAEPLTAILGAMQLEVTILREALTEPAERKIEQITFTTGKLDGRRAVIAHSGIGKVNAAITATLLLEHFKPSELLFTGIAGAINPEMRPGDIVIGTKTAQHDYGDLINGKMVREGTRNMITGKRNELLMPADTRLLSLAEVSAARIKLQALNVSGVERLPRILPGIIVTGDVFVADADKKTELRQALGADAVEMEGAAVAQVCAQKKTPCLVVRSISDSANAAAPEEYKRFARHAAENSAKLVRDIVLQLAATK